MKKIILFSLVLVLAFSFQPVSAIANPASVYCADMGYRASGNDCIFNDGQKCEQWAFFNGECGRDYIIELPCANSGETLTPGRECCGDLVSVGIKISSSGGLCPMIAGAWPICAPCGNDVCDEEFENECNCPKDCKASSELVNCGDGICQNVTCSAIGCPKAENEENCPQDCAVGNFSQVCRFVGTRSEGWYDEETGKLIKYENCGSERVCPQFAPALCESGKLVDQGLDENGCQRPPMCVEETITTSANVAACPAGCVCKADSVFCPAVNMPVAVQINYGTSATASSGGGSQSTQGSSATTLFINKTSEGSTTIRSGETEAVSSGNIRVVENKLYFEDSEQISKEVKIMPSVVSDVAVNRLGEIKNVQIELKEVGKAEESKPVYEVKAEKKLKIFGLLPLTAKVSTSVDAQTGQVISVKKPWWSFLAW